MKEMDNLKKAAKRADRPVGDKLDDEDEEEDEQDIDDEEELPDLDELETINDNMENNNGNVLRLNFNWRLKMEV